jgi:exonuclease SbcC
LLESLELEDFQRWDRLLIEFGPGVTCLQGPTDAGKTAVLRALRWLVLNLPLGGRFTRHGQSSCRALLKLDGRELLRLRGKDDNLYSLDGEDYRAFKADVPPAVSQLLALGEVNFQRQLDAPYFLTLPAPEVSRQLNAVVDLGVIDGTLSAAAARLRETSGAAESLLREVAEASAEVDNLTYVDKLSTDLTALEVLEGRIAEARSKRSQAAKCLENARVAAGERDRSGALLKTRSSAVENLRKTADCLREARGRRETLRGALRRVGEAGELCREKSATLKKAEAALAALGESCPLCGASRGGRKASSPCSAPTCT